MEKAKLQKQKTVHTKKQPPQSNKPTLIWDCGSSLYDSFELKSFERQLSSALVSRTLSMPHLSEPGSKQPTSSMNISRSIRRLVRSIFKPRIRDHNDADGNKGNKSRAGPDVVYYEFNKFNSTKRSSMKSSSNVVMMRRSGSVADATRRAAPVATSLGA